MSKDYIVNLEQRRGQPGRYRLTSQEVEAEAIYCRRQRRLQSAWRMTCANRATAQPDAQPSTI